MLYVMAGLLVTFEAAFTVFVNRILRSRQMIPEIPLASLAIVTTLVGWMMFRLFFPDF